MVRYLLDSKVLSEMMRPAPDPKVVARIDKVARQGIGLASTTVWEIFNGIGLLPSVRLRDQVEAQPAQADLGESIVSARPASA